MLSSDSDHTHQLANAWLSLSRNANQFKEQILTMYSAMKHLQPREVVPKLIDK